MKKIIFYLFTACTLASCSDFLEVEPDRQISINEQLSTAQGLEEAVNGLYRDLEALLSSKLFPYGDLMGGNLTYTPTVSTREVNIRAELAQVYNFADLATGSDFESYYGDSYNLINQVNLLLENKARFTYLSAERLQQLEAELLAMRALVHYQLALLYSQNYGFTPNATHLGIVYNTATLTIGVDFPSRASLANVYTLLKADLDRSLELFTNNSFLPEGTPQSVFNRINTQALYARMALQMNDWSQAASLANEVITNSGVQLTPQASYLAAWAATTPLSETLLSFTAPADGSGNVGSSISAYFLYSTPTLYGAYAASGDLLSSFESGDLRRNLIAQQAIPTNQGGTVVNENYHFSQKYQRDSGTMCIRLSEIYLIHAEALERENPGTTVARERFNAIRTRAGLNALGAITLDDILTERRQEFAFENMYFYDLARYQKSITRNLGCISAVCNLSYPSPFYILPIPQRSVLSNPNMTQNEGY